MEVIATTPLPGLGTALKDVPANVQLFGRRDLARQRPTDLPQFLELNANSIGLGSAQGNPYQSDLNFRGFAASPIFPHDSRGRGGWQGERQPRLPVCQRDRRAGRPQKAPTEEVILEASS